MNETQVAKANGKEHAQVQEQDTTAKISVSPSALKLAMFEQSEDPEKHSLEYIIEDCLVMGLKARRRSREYTINNRNRANFQKELQSNPMLAADPVAISQLLKKYKIV